MSQYIQNIFNKFNYTDHDVNFEEDEYQVVRKYFKQKKNPYSTMKKLFKKDFTNDDILDIIKYIKNEIEYIEKLMDFDKEIKVENVLILTNYKDLLRDFELLEKQKEFDNENWLVIEHQKPVSKVYSFYYFFIGFFKTIKSYLSFSK